DGDVAAMLRGIAAQEGIDPDQAALALRLAEVVPGLNVTVVPPPAGAAEAGMYDNGTGELWVRQATPSIVLHEVLHGVTSALLTNPAARRGNPEVAQAVREFGDLLAAAQARYAEMVTAGEDIPAPLARMLADPRGPLSNVKELLAYGMTDKRFQQWLVTVPAP